MTRAEVIEYFGSVAGVAEHFGITTQAVYDWGEKVPLVRQLMLEKYTDGKLNADDVGAGKAA